jgi:hypothetical protein
LRQFQLLKRELKQRGKQAVSGYMSYAIGCQVGAESYTAYCYDPVNRHERQTDARGFAMYCGTLVNDPVCPIGTRAEYVAMEGVENNVRFGGGEAGFILYHQTPSTPVTELDIGKSSKRGGFTTQAFLQLYATRDIQVGEQLFWSYGPNYWFGAHSATLPASALPETGAL